MLAILLLRQFVMESFPVRRGIGISRTPQAVPQFLAFPKDPPPQQFITKTTQPQITVMSRPAQPPSELHPFRPPATHARTFSMGVPSAPQGDQGFSAELAFKEQSFKQGSVQLHLPQAPPKFLPFPSGSINSQIIQGVQGEQSKAVNQSGKEDLASTLVSQPNGYSFLQVQTHPKSPTKVNSAFKAETFILAQHPRQSPLSEISEIAENKLPASTAQNPILKLVLKEKEQLQQQLTKVTLQQQSWQKEREALLKQIQQKCSLGKQLQERSSQCEQQLRGRVAALQAQLRHLKGNKNRLEIEINSNKKLFNSEREKNEKAREQMNKLIFFEDDLIHAKDYNRLKDELEYVLAENARLFAEHQQYILEVSEGRKAAEGRLKELQEEVGKLKAEQRDYEAKLETVGRWGEEKMVALKLQSEINFLRKKCEEQVEQLRSKDAQLDEALSQIQRLSGNQGGSVLDEISIRQMNDAVSLYEGRLVDLSESLKKSQAEAEKHKKTVELLTSELRRTREDRTITALRDRSSENSLKNDVEMLQKGHSTELQLKNKRICNLEEALQRKGKEILEKDRFIKEFLISRAKQLDGNQVEMFLQNLKEYFQSSPQPESVGQAGQTDR